MEFCFVVEISHNFVCVPSSHLPLLLRLAMTFLTKAFAYSEWIGVIRI